MPGAPTSRLTGSSFSMPFLRVEDIASFRFVKYDIA
jgi:hypothetical protein